MLSGKYGRDQKYSLNVEKQGIRNMNIRNGFLINKMLITTMTVVAIAMFAGSAGSAVDVMIIGKFLGQREVSASGIVLPVIGVFSVISTIFGNGLQLILSDVISKGDKKRASEVFTTSLIAVFAITSVAAAFLFIFSPELCNALGLTGRYEALAPLGVAYCRGYAIGIPFFSAAISVNQSLQLDGDRTLGLCAVLISTAINIMGDIICATVLHAGLFDLALVTSVSNFIMFMVILFHYRPGRTNLLIFVPANFRIRDISALVARGIPNAILIASEIVRGIVMNMTLLHISDDIHVAAASVMSSVNILEASLLSGFFATVSIISGVVAGEDDKKGLQQIMRISNKIGGILSVFLILFTLLFSDILPHIFISDEKVTSITAFALKITVFSVPFRILSGIICGMYQGLKYTELSNIVYILRDLVIPSVCFIVFGHFFGATGVFAGMIAAYAVSFMIIMLYPLIRFRKSSIQLPYKLLLLEDGDITYDSYEGSAGTLDEVSALSEEVRLYCIEKKCSKKMALITSVAIEEMCVNSIVHNNTGRTKHCIDVVLRKKDDGQWILRIRDDYSLFDPGEWLKEHEEEILKNPFHNFGIKMIFNMADDIMYTQLMQMNNLIIVISDTII